MTKRAPTMRRDPLMIMYHPAARQVHRFNHMSSRPLQITALLQVLFRSKFLKEISTRTYGVQSYNRSCSLTSLWFHFWHQRTSLVRGAGIRSKRGFQMEPGSLGCGITRLHVSYALDNDYRNVPHLSAINLCHAHSLPSLHRSSMCAHHHRVVFFTSSVFLWIHLVTISVLFQLFGLCRGRILILISGQSPRQSTLMSRSFPR